jgi:putative ABC transport system substrate-binding protein
MDRRRFLLTSLAGAFAAPLGVEAQPAADKVPRIGYLTGNVATSLHMRDAFLQGLRDLGYVEGRNVVIESRDAEGKPERLVALAAELVALKVDVIVAPGTLAALAATGATTTIPIVFPTVGDPIIDGLVESLPRPGGNVTGLTNLTVGELIGKALQLLKEALPRTSRVAALTQSGAAPAQTASEVVTRTKAAARALGVAVDFVEIRQSEDLDTAFAEMTRKRADALVVLPWATLFYQRRRIAALAAKHQLPAAYTYREYVELGGLMSYGPDLSDSFRRSATYVDKILKGAKPADLPVEQATKFELLINLKTAKALGLTIPPSLLARADQVIE